MRASFSWGNRTRLAFSSFETDGRLVYIGFLVQNLGRNCFELLVGWLGLVPSYRPFSIYRCFEIVVITHFLKSEGLLDTCMHRDSDLLISIAQQSTFIASSSDRKNLYAGRRKVFYNILSHRHSHSPSILSFVFSPRLPSAKKYTHVLQGSESPMNTGRQEWSECENR